MHQQKGTGRRMIDTFRVLGITDWGCGCFFGRLDGQSKALSVLHGTHPAQ